MTLAALISGPLMSFTPYKLSARRRDVDFPVYNKIILPVKDKTHCIVKELHMLYTRITMPSVKHL